MLGTLVYNLDMNEIKSINGIKKKSTLHLFDDLNIEN